MMQYPEREIALIAIYTGLTIIDICNLQWKHVNLDLYATIVNGEPIPPLSLAIRKE